MTNQLASLGVGGGGGGSGPVVLLLDHFTGADSTHLNAHAMDVGAGWTELASFVLASNQAESNDASGSDRIAYAEAGQADVTVSATVVLGTFTTGFAVRLTDANNYWRIGLEESGDHVDVYEKNAGSYVLRAQGSLVCAPGDTFSFAVAASGTTITVSAGGTVYASYASATFNQTATKMGLMSNTTNQQARWDDFEVTSP